VDVPFPWVIPGQGNGEIRKREPGGKVTWGHSFLTTVAGERDKFPWSPHDNV